jgi:hypothetical protein
MNNENSKAAEAADSAGFGKLLLATSRTLFPKRHIAVLVLLSATAVLFVIQVILDVNHLKRVSLLLSIKEFSIIRRAISNHDQKLLDDAAKAAREGDDLGTLSEKPRTAAEMEQRETSQQEARLHAYLKEQSQAIDRQTAKMDDFLRRVYSDEAKYTQLRILVDSVWLVVASLSAIAAFKRIAFSAFFAVGCSQVLRWPAPLLQSAPLRPALETATGTFFVWPLGVSSLGNSVFWPTAIMFQWIGVLLGLSLKGSELQNGQQRP